MNPSIGTQEKNIISDKDSIATTIYSSIIPLDAPLVNINQDNKTTEIIPIIILLISNGSCELIKGSTGSKASVNAIR